MVFCVRASKDIHPHTARHYPFICSHSDFTSALVVIVPRPRHCLLGGASLSLEVPSGNREGLLVLSVKLVQQELDEAASCTLRS